MKELTSIVGLMRPKQWAKNVFVFLPMFFGAQLLNIRCIVASVWAFVAFSLIASAVYCLNDMLDVADDRKHPVKCRRPIASGDVSMVTAAILTGALICASLSLSIFVLRNIGVVIILMVYLLMNVAYCIKLKQFAIIDVFIISIGFVLRLVAGGYACDIWLTPWIVLMTFLVALFLAFAKRRDDVAMQEKDGVVYRKNTIRYNLPYMNITLGLIGAITIVCYIMYTVSEEVIARIGSEYVYITSIFVLAAILRYLQVAIVDVRSGSPTRVLFKDRFIQVCIICWIALFLILIYL